MTAAEERMQKDIVRLRTALITALSWIAQSANSPLRPDEVRDLIRMAESDYDA